MKLFFSLEASIFFILYVHFKIISLIQGMPISRWGKIERTQRKKTHTRNIRKQNLACLTCAGLKPTLDTVVGWLIWGLMSHQQLRSYGEGTSVYSLIQQTGEARIKPTTDGNTRPMKSPWRLLGHSGEMIKGLKVNSVMKSVTNHSGTEAVKLQISQCNLSFTVKIMSWPVNKFSHDEDHMSYVMRKPDFCMCENKGADQLRSNCEADQRLCFRYTDSGIPPLIKSKFSSF